MLWPCMVVRHTRKVWEQLTGHILSEATAGKLEADLKTITQHLKKERK